jgi:hypothetical protein
MGLRPLCTYMSHICIVAVTTTLDIRIIKASTGEYPVTSGLTASNQHAVLAMRPGGVMSSWNLLRTQISSNQLKAARTSACYVSCELSCMHVRPCYCFMVSPVLNYRRNGFGTRSCSVIDLDKEYAPFNRAQHSSP